LEHLNETYTDIQRLRTVLAMSRNWWGHYSAPSTEACFWQAQMTVWLSGRRSKRTSFVFGLFLSLIPNQICSVPL
jgi:hypothetical protein